METFSVTFQGETISLSCEEGHEEEANMMLEGLCELLQSDPTLLAHDTQLNIGWSALRFQEEEDGFWLQEPDFGDDVSSWRDDFTTTLSVLGQQQQTLVKLEVDGEPYTYEEHVLFQPGALQAALITMERLQMKDGSTVWFINLADDQEDEGDTVELDSVPSYQLLQLRPVLVPLLLLPTGYLALVHEEKVIDIIDGDSISVLF